jgi:CRISP-associated protein Cas1
VTQVLNVLFVQTQGAYLSLEHDAVRIEVERNVVARVPLHHLQGITVFGNVLLSPFLIARCTEEGREINLMTEYGRFRARIYGSKSGNVLLRRAQHHALGSVDATLAIAKRFVAGKLQNSRNVLVRAARETKEPADSQALRGSAQVLAQSLKQVAQASDLDVLRGIEGSAARAYFSAFSHMIRQHRELFLLSERNKRPPRDPINALLSFVYAILTSECASALEGVGLDAQVGYLHALRPGRPALALDLVEEFRSFLGDRLVLTLINRGQMELGHFEQHTGGAWSLNEEGRKVVLAEFQNRKRQELTHPVTQQNVPLGLVPHVQARLLARHLRGDLVEYPPFIPKV